MSLAAVANHLASKGRGSDSMLVHMTPNEVKGLQAIAVAHGGSLTVNPDTGLVEAGWLDKLLPAIAGAALSFVPGFNAIGAGMLVGALQTARTGSLKEGLAAGLGAYGGAGLATGISAAGAASSLPEQLGYSQSELASGLGGGAEQLGYTPSELAKGFGAETAASSVASEGTKAAVEEAAKNTPTWDKFTSGIDRVTSKGGLDALKSGMEASGGSLLRSGMAAAAPLMAGNAVSAQGPQTVTQAPRYIRPMAFNPYSHELTQLPLVQAAEGGVMGGNFRDGGGDGNEQSEFVWKNEPVVRMADGGDSNQYLYQNLTSGSTPEQVAAAYKQFAELGGGNTQANQAAAVDYLHSIGIGDQTIGQAYQQYLTPQAPAQTTTVATPVDYAAAAAPQAQAAQAAAPQYLYQGLTSTSTPDQIEAAYKQFFDVSGYNQANRNAAVDYLQSIGIGLGDVQKGFGEYLTDYRNTPIPTQAQELYRGLGPMNDAYDVANAYKQFTDIAAGGNSQYNQAAAVDYLRSIGIDDATIREAYQHYLNNEFTRPKVVKPGAVGTQTFGTVTNSADYSNIPSDVNTKPQGVSWGGTGVQNPDGSITMYPTIPGRPAGGFTGMQQVKDVYTQGGGSLGYTPYTPKTYQELLERYPNTGGSKAAYDYLMGKAAYPVNPVSVSGGPIAKSYAESMGLTGLGPKIVMPKTTATATSPTTTTTTATGLQVSPAQKTALQSVFNSALDTNDFSAFNSLLQSMRVTATDLKQIFPGITDADIAKYADKVSFYVPPTSVGTETGATGGLMGMAGGGPVAFSDGGYNLGGYSDGGRLLQGPGDGVSDDIPATIGDRQPARLADGEFVVPARIVSEIGNGSTSAGAKKLYAMMDRVQKARGKTVGKGKVARDTNADKYLPA